MRADNFGAGPAAMPTSVLEQARDELVDFEGTGMSVMEISHRSPVYERIHANTESLLRELLAIPHNYRVLFLQGGASLQFSMIPMNLLARGSRAGYVLTGSWSEKALAEATLIAGEREAAAVVAASSKGENYTRLPDLTGWDVTDKDVYVHITSNNTIYGSQWQTFPQHLGVPLVADMSSDILSKPFDITPFGLVYAGAQKNLGPSGLTVVIIRDDVLEASVKGLPTMLQYGTHAKNRSLYNTPPTFAIYLMGLTLQWIRDEGGLDSISRRNEEKAGLLYDTMDGSEGFYRGVVDTSARSRMNVTFRLGNEEQEQKFLSAAEQAGFVGLAGHRSVGGCRASLYNAVSVESCRRLVNFMKDFQAANA